VISALSTDQADQGSTDQGSTDQGLSVCGKVRLGALPGSRESANLPVPEGVVTRCIILSFWRSGPTRQYGTPVTADA
jgi:hypothetical protein